ncbi:MAG: LPS export ABC transporter periplasmic protein LptC [Parvibaculum sp.]|mgnify:CR=1 FL=1|nr:LPS export ABC transporter periplasmic protein LptC [Parvibaculum sp.]|tara:strand:- start:1399 stop:2103 length:705 start_codon:yes stop_codon:yes gene_type:complete
MNGPRDPDASDTQPSEHAHPGLDHLDLPFGDLAPAAKARIGRHSSFVSMMKIALPLGAVALFALVLFYSGVFDSRDRLDITFREIATLNNDLRMVSPRITGLDKSGQPYLLTADTATQGKAGTSLIELDNLQADLKMSDDGEWVSLAATSGLLNTETETLDLNQKIDVYVSTGYEFHGTEGQINFRNGDFVSNAPVEGHGPAGTLRADKMTADNATKTMIFTGRVKMRFYGEQP